MLAVNGFIRKILISPILTQQQTRNTYVLKRKSPPPLHKANGHHPKMRGRHFIYDLIEDKTLTKRPPVKIILTEYVEGLGYPGDVHTLRAGWAYKDFILLGRGVYATPENLEKYKADESKQRPVEMFSSPFVQATMRQLSSTVLYIHMNKLVEWKLEPWHVKVAFRRAQFVVPEYAITMPPADVRGPDLTLQYKEFYVTITLNNKEKVNVRCRIHHFATGRETLPFDENHRLQPCEPLFPEQAQVLADMPLPDITPDRIQ